MADFLKGLFRPSPAALLETPTPLPLKSAEAPPVRSAAAPSTPNAPAAPVATPTPTAPTPPPEPQGPRDPTPPPAAGGPLDFAEVVRRAGVSEGQTTKVKKAQDLLRSLPRGTTPSLKRQIVEAAFAAFDIPIGQITEAATATIAAIDAYVAAGEKVRQQAVHDGNTRIAELEAQIAAVRADIDTANKAQEARDAAARDEVSRVRPILGFFVPGADADADADAEPSADADAAEVLEVDGDNAGAAAAVEVGDDDLEAFAGIEDAPAAGPVVVTHAVESLDGEEAVAPKGLAVRRR